MKSHRALITSLSLLVFHPAFAVDDPNAWSRQQTVHVKEAGLVRWTVPLETLGHAAPDRRDLRLIDPLEGEVPYLLDEPRRSEGAWVGAKKVEAQLDQGRTVLNVTPSEAGLVDGIRLETPAREFLKSVTVSARVAGVWRETARHRPIFRQGGGAENLFVEFPAVKADLLRVTVDADTSQPIPLFGASLRRPSAPAEGVETFPLRILSREEGATETRLRLELPQPHLFVDEIVIQTEEPLFQRTASLLISRLETQGDQPGQTISEYPAATGTIYRISREGERPAEEVKVSVRQRLDVSQAVLVIQNNDNPPLAITGIQATVLPVRLMFRAGAAGDFRLLLGNPRAAFPAYDLALLRTALLKGPFQGATADPSELNPSYQPPEVLPDLAESGAVLDTRAWACRAPVTLERPGFHRLEMPLFVLSQAGDSGRDIRLLREGKQVPFLADRTPVGRSLVPTAVRLPDDKGKSRWELALPYKNLPVTHVECRVADRLFQRTFVVYEEVENTRGEIHRNVLAQHPWARTGASSTERRALPLSRPPRTSRIVIEVDNGDNAPLALDGFKVYYRTWRVVFKASPGGELFLYYGNPQAHWPQYDLSLVAHEALSAPQAEATLGAEAKLKSRIPWSTAGPEGPWKILFWTVLALVVVALLFIMRKLLPGPGPEKKAP